MALLSIPTRKWRSRLTRSVGRTEPEPKKTGTISAWRLCFSFTRFLHHAIGWRKRRSGHERVERRAAPGVALRLHRGSVGSVERKRYRRSVQYRMGSPFEVTVYGDEGACSNAIEAAFSEIARIERLLTIYRPESPLAGANRFSRKGFFPLPSDGGAVGPPLGVRAGERAGIPARSGGNSIAPAAGRI